jgi:phage gpG-like protein
MPDLLGPVNVSSHYANSMGIIVDMDPSAILLVAWFDKLGLDIRSFRVPLERSVKEVVSPSLEKNFYAQGRPDQWQELSEDTVYRKERDGYGGTAPFPLVRSGALRDAAASPSIWNIDGMEGVATIELPESVWYGRVHQEGSGGGAGSVTRHKSRLTGQIIERTLGTKGTVPQRIWAVIQDEDIDAIEEVFDKWMEERLRGQIFRR